MPANPPGACGFAPIVDAHARPNIFTPQQEMWLGEAWGDMIVDENVPIKDAALNQHLQSIVDKLAKNLPEPHVNFHVVLVESPDVNGWSIAGGSIFITRKLASTANSDDELATVLGHEMGHIASHQFAFEMTEEFQRLLGVTSFTDKKDVYAKYHALIDASMKDRHPPKSKDDDDQGEADKIGVYLAASAGYDVSAYADFFDRSFFVEGKTGGKLTDLLGLTKPNQKRLRGMKAMVAQLPAACRTAPHLPAEQLAFEQWRRKVRENQKSVAGAAIAENEAVVKLDQPLHMELDRIRFSPDGKMLLAQDESSIYVLSQQPLAVKFRIDADNAQRAWFSPDSQRVTFVTPGLHTEEWNVSDDKLLNAHEIVSKDTCLQSKLTPDGRTIVCLFLVPDEDVLGLSLLDVASGQMLWETRHFYQPPYQSIWNLLLQHQQGIPIESLYSSYSSDGNTLLIGPWNNKLAFDLKTRQPIKIGGELQSMMDGAYAFIGNDRVAMVKLGSGSGILSFPDGKRITKMKFAMDQMDSLSNTAGNAYALSTSIYGLLQNRDEKPDKKDGYKNAAHVENRAGVNELESGRWLFASRSAAIDMWGTNIVTEGTDGSLVMAQLVDGKPTGGQKVQLPTSPLGHLRAVAVSPDGRFLAYSTRDRGGVWDLQSGKRLALLRAFRDVAWPDSLTLVGDFEKSSKGDREITVFDLAEHSSHPAVDKLADDAKDYERMDHGYFTEWKAEKGKARTLVIHSFTDHSVLWSKSFPDGSPWWTTPTGSGEAIFTYPMTSETGKASIKGDAVLAQQAVAIKEKEDGRLIEIVDAATGAAKTKVVLEKPGDYYGTGGLNHVGDDLLVTGSDNRTLIYSVKTGKRLWQTFGWVLTVDPASQRIAVWNRANEVIVFDTSGNELLHTQGGEKIRYAKFLNEGKTLVTLTSDQAIHTFPVGDQPLTK